MPSKIWELHAQRFEGAIRTTADGTADVAGLHFTEKAYLLVVRDLRPAEVVRMVQRDGPAAAGAVLASRFDGSDGHGLTFVRNSVDPLLLRSDEVPALSSGRRG